MLFMSVFTVHLFLGGWTFFNIEFYISYVINFFGDIFNINLTGFAQFIGNTLVYILYFIKIFSIIYLFIAVRAAIPRYRYDQLMRIGWKYLLPVVFVSLIINIFVVYFFFPLDFGGGVIKKII